MNRRQIYALQLELGIRDGQMREPNVHKNLWWSFDGGESSFGYGDLDEQDLNNIHAWLSNGQPEHDSMTFTAWNEHHDTTTQQTPYAMIKITKNNGITYPNREARVR